MIHVSRHAVLAPALVLLGACAASHGAPAADSLGTLRPQYPSTYTQRPHPPVLIRNATILTAAGPELSRASILLDGGKVAAVGQKAQAPPGATVVDGTGKFVTPGLIDTHSHLGVYAAPGTRSQSDGNERTDAVTAQVWAEHSFWPQDPEGGKESGGGSRAGAVLLLRRVLRDALEYAERKEDFRRAQIQPLAATAEDLEALQPVLRGELPLFVIANRRSDIESALRIARDFKLRIAIYGGVEAWKTAAALAAARVPVILEPLTDVPTFDALGARLDNATLLREAGVTVVAAQSDAAHFRDLRQAAGNEVRNGMPWDEALRSVTLAAAEAALVGDRYGSLEAGKVGNMVVWSGDPLELSSRVEHLFIRGRAVPLVSRQTELLERYRTLPPRY
jgi:imidazolonepropionase-like amidohydrolase